MDLTPVKKAAAALAAGLTAAFAGLALSSAAHATTVPTRTPCALPAGFFVNLPDEADRVPTAGLNGLTFTGADLIHHATSVPLAHLKPGSFYVAHGSAYPDQPSFFSVEVRDPDGAYGTLRWDTVLNTWTLTTNLGTFSHDDPADFIGTPTKWGVITSKTTAVTFGVGYTANPQGKAKVTVRTIDFNHKGYDLRCKPAPTSSSASPKPSTSSSATPTASTSTSTKPSHTAGGVVTTTTSTRSGALAVTGPNGWLTGGIAAVLLGGGTLTVLAARRRKTNFQA